MKSIVLYATLMVALIMQSCQQREADVIFDPDEKAAVEPEITAIEPARAAFASFSEIKIIGQGFVAGTDSSLVYFNNIKTKILSLGPTEIRVKAPDLISDSVTIQVVVPGAFSPAKFSPYKLEAVSIEYGGFGNLDDIQSIAIDKDENLYAHLKTKEIIKVSLNGEHTVIGTTSFPKSVDMAAGPSGYLYVVKKFGTKLYRFPYAGGDEEEFAALPKKIESMDFDANLNIFGMGNRSGVVRIAPDGSAEIKGDLGDFNVKTVRVFNDHLYFMGQYRGSDTTLSAVGIWRAPILNSNGDMGAVEEILDWSTTADYARAAYYAITFSQSGEMYVGTSAEQPILTIHPDGSFEPLYEGILIPIAADLVWGNSSFLYVNRINNDDTLKRIIRIGMGTEGAPYFGRQ